MDQVSKRATRARRRGQKGFTLIELLVVIAVLAILAAIVIFNVVGVTNKGTNSSACTEISPVRVRKTVPSTPTMSPTSRSLK